jgi:hypothetical protein
VEKPHRAERVGEGDAVTAAQDLEAELERGQLGSLDLLVFDVLVGSDLEPLRGRSQAAIRSEV